MRISSCLILSNTCVRGTAGSLPTAANVGYNATGCVVSGVRALPVPADATGGTLLPAGCAPNSETDYRPNRCQNYVKGAEEADFNAPRSVTCLRFARAFKRKRESVQVCNFPFTFASSVRNVNMMEMLWYGLPAENRSVTT
jgi:hypothetical protein